MKISIIACVLLLATVLYAKKAEVKENEKKEDWVDMVDSCVDSVRKQIQAEMDASIQYLMMGAYFSKDSVNRPGFAKFFFEAASEERQHSIKLITYLLQRGELTKYGSNSLLEVNPTVIATGKPSHWKSGVKALKDALALEQSVTMKIKGVIGDCENAPFNSTTNVNDYELVDYLTGEFLKEQYEGQRDLAGRISTLTKLMETHGILGEFLYDKTLLS